jgi:hypothetical protein
VSTSWELERAVVVAAGGQVTLGGHVGQDLIVAVDAGLLGFGALLGIDLLGGVRDQPVWPPLPIPASG